MEDPLSDCSPLISAAASGKLRLVRLLVEGGAKINGHNPRGETALLAACKALRGEPAGPEIVKLLTFLLQNEADPNAQDRCGRTPLMYACMERAGPHVASVLLSAGADPSMVDYSGASALVYAINAQHQPTLKVLMDTCRARGRDIIIIATEMGVNGGHVTRRYLNVPPSPDTSPVSCMSPSDIVLKTGSPSSPEGDNIFNFRGTSKRGSSSGSGSSRHPSCELSTLSVCSSCPPPRQRLLSEPWLVIHNLACLNRAYEEGIKERNTHKGDREDLRREEEEEEDEEAAFHQARMEGAEESMVQRHNYSCREDLCPRLSQSVLSLTECKRSQSPAGLDKVTPKSCVENLPAFPSPSSQLRRNTLPSVMVVPPLLHRPPLVNQSDFHLKVPGQVSPSKSRSMVFLPRPPSSPSPSRTSFRVAFLPPLSLSSSVSSLVSPPASCCGERNRSLRRHSVQLPQIIRGVGPNMDHEDL